MQLELPVTDCYSVFCKWQWAVTLLNPVVESLTKKHICVAVSVSGRVCERSGASTISLHAPSI